MYESGKRKARTEAPLLGANIKEQSADLGLIDFGGTVAAAATAQKPAQLTSDCHHSCGAKV